MFQLMHVVYVVLQFQIVINVKIHQFVQNVKKHFIYLYLRNLVYKIAQKKMVILYF